MKKLNEVAQAYEEASKKAPKKRGMTVVIAVGHEKPKHTCPNCGHQMDESSEGEE